MTLPARIEKKLDRLEKSKDFWFLLPTSILFFLLRLPSLFEPHWYGDEGIYQVLGLGLREGRPLYQGVFDNKPPLLYILYSVFNGDQFWLRFANLFFGIATVIAFYFLAKALFKKQKIIYISSSIFAFLLAIPIIEGNIANAENFMLFPIIAAGYLLFKNSQKLLNHENKDKLNKAFFTSGFLLGIAFLVKIVALFDFVAFLIFLIFASYFFSASKRKAVSIFLIIKKSFIFAIGFIIPIVVTVFYFIFANAFDYFAQAALFSNIGYVGYGNKFLIPQGLLILKSLLLSIFIIFIFFKRKKIELTGVFIFLWLGFSLFNAFFSQRPYTHYLLTLLPSFSLLIGYFFYQKGVRRFTFILIVVIFYLSTSNFWLFKRSAFYYQNFSAFVSGSKNLENYQKFFDSNTPRDYLLAQFINANTKEEENIFVWGNNAQLYKMTNKLPPGRYSVAYHITNYKDGLENTEQGLLKSQPKFIIFMPYMKHYPFSLKDYTERLSIGKALIYEKTF
ncbi:phospholipid carrier-dependent glycosyltransferase [Patescibacteria group bacterium]|nr:phospholipid carrier-dependent glycosyltransferase [Patescibacteria group bacterium]